jgi:transposase
MRTSHNTPATISTIGIDVGKNTFHLVGLDKRGAIVLQQKVTRHQLGRRLSNIPRPADPASQETTLYASLA